MLLKLYRISCSFERKRLTEEPNGEMYFEKLTSYARFTALFMRLNAEP